jgi:hypothetical protein
MCNALREARKRLSREIDAHCATPSEPRLRNVRHNR